MTRKIVKRSTFFFLIFVSHRLLWFEGVIAVISSEHLFQSLLQRRAKPLRWKWNNDLIKSADVQRQRRFLPEESVVKWWKEMAPKKDARTSSIINKDSLDSTRETYFKRRTHFSHYKRPRLTESFKKENKNSFLFNNTQSFREDNFRQSRQPSFDNILSLPLQNAPFEKDNNVFAIEHALSPTEKTYLGEHFPSAFGSLQSIPQQNEQEDYRNKKTEHNTSSHSDHEIDSELLREAIIQERHKPSKFEKLSASQRLKDSERTGRNLQNAKNQQPRPSVEYIVPSVERVLSHVEYVDNISGSLESQIPSVLSSVEYVSPTVEFVEPEVEYLPELNTTTDSVSLFEIENPLTDKDIPVLEEESFANERKYPLDRYDSEGLTDIDGARFQIVGLRREQIRVRRNHRRNQQLGVPDEDYPTLEALPVVQFHCGDYQPGYYVDITTRCQVFHICHENGRRSSFLCPVGTVFNQEYLVCDWWYNVDCEGSPRFYSAETLQAYSSNTENKRIYSKPVAPKEKSFKPNRETSKPNQSFHQNVKQNKPVAENNSKTTHPNLSQKAVNYPVGYAILLREYMKNSLNGNSKPSERNDHNSFEKNTKQEAKNKKIQEEKENNKAFLPNLSSLDKEDNDDDFPSFSPLGNPDYVFESYKYQPRYFGGSKPYNPSPAYTNQDKNRVLESPQTNSYKTYIREFLDASKELEYEYDDRVRDVLHASYQKEAVPLDKNKDITTSQLEQPRNAFENQKIVKNKNLDENHKNHPLRTNPKFLNKNSDSINSYRFIIDPSEAIKPASTQYVQLEKHLNSNSSAIKFRHAESTIKHVKSRNNDKLTFTTNARNGKISKRNSEENFASNSDSIFSLSVAPSQKIKYRYGERLTKPSSTPKDKESPIIFNKAKPENIRNSTYPRHYISTTKKPERQVFYNINQMKNIPNDSNYTFELMPVESKRKFDFAKINQAPNLFLNNYKAQKEKLKNETNTFEKPKNEKEKDYMSNKKKMTISVRIERNEISLKDMNNKNVSINTNMSLGAENYTVQHVNQSSVYTTTPLPYNELPQNASHSNKTENITQDASFKEDEHDIKSLNLTKISNLYGGYTIVKVAAIVQNQTANSTEDKKDLTMLSTQQLETNRTIHTNSSVV